VYRADLRGAGGKRSMQRGSPRGRFAGDAIRPKSTEIGWSKRPPIRSRLMSAGRNIEIHPLPLPTLSTRVDVPAAESRYDWTISVFSAGPASSQHVRRHYRLMYAFIVRVRIKQNYAEWRITRRGAERVISLSFRCHFVGFRFRVRRHG